MKRKPLMLLLAIVVITSVSTTQFKTVSGYSGKYSAFSSEFNKPVNPSPSRVETFSIRDPRGTYKEVQVFLPKGYDSSGDNYPVLYLSDGGSYLSYVDDMPFIIVGITFTWDERWYNYSPWVNNEMDKWFGLSATLGGGGDEYLSYLVSLKTNNIDTTYRTKPERQYTAIGGHSMGGVFALYAGIKRNDIFSKVIAFSPAVWFGSRDINNWLSSNNLIDFIASNNAGNVSFFTYVGGKEDHDHEAPGYPLVGQFPEIYVAGAKAVHNLVGGEFIYDPDGVHATTDFLSWFHAVKTWLYATGFGFTLAPPTDPAQVNPESINPAQESNKPTSTLEPYIEPIIKATPKEDGSVIHVVRYGQSLWSIADHYEIPLAELLEQNSLTEESTVFLDQELIIVPAHAEDEDLIEASNSEEEPVPTETITPTPTKTKSPTPTITHFLTPTNEILSPTEDIETSGISSLKIFDGHTPLWIGIGFIIISLSIFALVTYPSLRKYE